MTLDQAALTEQFVAAGLPQVLVDELFEAFNEAKKRFFLDDLRPNAVEGGRFSEAAFRVLEELAFSKHTPVGRTLPTVDDLLKTLINSGHSSDSVRIHIPRTLRLIYDIRNKRDAAHLADGIDPNLQDATLVVAAMDWVLAEFVRLLSGLRPDAAQAAIAEITTKVVPVIQEVNGFPRVLRDMRASEHVLLLLYWAGSRPVTVADLKAWVPAKMKTHVRRTIQTLHTKHLVDLTGEAVVLLKPGARYVIEHKLIQPV